MKDFNNLPEWLPKKIDKLGVTTEKFSRMCGISRAQLYRYLTDASRPSEQHMARICRVLGIPFEEGLRQYVPKPVGRPVGSGTGTRELSVRRR